MSAIHLVRHGQASFGASDYDQLSAMGDTQARVLGAALAPFASRFTTVVAGEMRRHRQTAQACLQAMARDADWQGDGDWNEFDHVRLITALRPEYADHDVLRAALQAAPDPQRALKAMFEQAMARWVAGEHDGDYAETWTQFRARCRSALGNLLEALPPRTDALVFTSGGPIAAIAQDLLGMPDAQGSRLSWGLVNCGITKLVRTADGGIRLATLNGHAHFEGEHAALLTYR